MRTPARSGGRHQRRSAERRGLPHARRCARAPSMPRRASASRPCAVSRRRIACRRRWSSSSRLRSPSRETRPGRSGSFTTASSRARRGAPTCAPCMRRCGSRRLEWRPRRQMPGCARYARLVAARTEGAAFHRGWSGRRGRAPAMVRADRRDRVGMRPARRRARALGAARASAVGWRRADDARDRRRSAASAWARPEPPISAAG